MKKQHIIGIALFFLIALLVVFLFRRQYARAPISIVQAVPVDAGIIIESNDFPELIRQLNNESAVWNIITNIDQCNKVKKDIAFLDSLFSVNNEIKNSIKKSTCIFSVHKEGKDNLCLIGFLQFPEKKEERKLRWLMQQSSLNLTERKYEGETVYTLDVGRKEKRKIYCAFVSNLLLFSPSLLQLEKAIRQSSSGINISQNSHFRKVAATAGINSKANIYVNYEMLPPILQLLILPAHKKASNDIGNMAAWTEMDIKIRNDILLFNGFSSINDSSNNYLKILQSQTPQTFTSDKILAPSVIFFVSLNISNYGLFCSRYNSYLQNGGLLNTQQQKIRAINQYLNTDIHKNLQNIFDGEICLAVSDIKNNDAKDNVFILIKTRSRSLAENEMLSLLRQYANRANKKMDDYVFTYKPDNEIRHHIYTMPVPDLPSLFFGNLFAGGDNNFFTFIENYLVLGNSVKALSALVHSNILKKNLANDNAYRNLNEHMASQSNLFFYTDFSRAIPWMEKYLTKKLHTILQSNIETFVPIQGCVLQISSANNMMYNNLFVKYGTSIKTSTSTVWESLLDSSLSSKPAIVINHRSKEKEIIVQDKKNNLYLINSAGRILWKVQLPEQILSDIYQVDYYRNRKLQLLFNTRNKIYLLDRNGNAIERYPLSLRAPATNGLALFDYDQNKNYRILIACEDRKIYNYTIDGNLLKDWICPKTESTISSSLQFFRTGNKDYILCADDIRIYIFNRKGEERIKIHQEIKKSAANKFYLSDKAGKEAFLTTDVNGSIIYINTSGNIETVRIKEYEPTHFFDFNDVDADGEKDYIFLNNNKLEVFTQDKKTIISYKTPEPVEHAPIYFSFTSNDKRIGLVSEKGSEIYLISNKGKLSKGFPLKGSSAFSISRLVENTDFFTIIVGSNDNFLYNYSLQ